MRLTGVAPIVFAIDTSGSMSEKYLRQSISELNTLIEEVALNRSQLFSVTMM